MDDFNSLCNIIKGSIPMVQSGISAVVGSFITSMFLRGNTQRVEFEKIKMGKVQEVIDDLVKSHELTLTELIKCNNLIKIAKIADREYKTREHETNNKFDFDWFLRFFEAAGNISNENMQILWARILAGEIQAPGAFSLRTIETLRNMTQSEAIIFQKIARIILIEGNDSKFIYRDEYIYSEGKTEINKLYGIDGTDFSLMEELGIISPFKKESHINVREESATCIYNGNIILVFQPKTESSSNEFLVYNNYDVTQTAIQLLSIINIQPDDNYILDLGLFFRDKYPDFSITAHRIVEHNENIFKAEFDVDILDS